MAGGGQLPLVLGVDRHARFESFLVEDNHTVVAHLRAVAEGTRRELVWVYGEEGSGKSHLMQAACAVADESGRRAMYLALDEATEPEVLAGLDSVEFLAIDDVQRVAGKEDLEQGLFSILNAAYGGTVTLVLAADRAPAALAFALADLASRACGAAIYRLKALSDEAQVRALMRHAEIRGFELDAAAAAYLYTRVKREMKALVGWLDRLDRESLIAQRKVTVPFVRALLESTRGES